MGRTLKSLVSKKLNNKECIFNNRLVVELAETFHIHYRNLRIILSLEDFKEIGKGLVQAYTRWRSRGEPGLKEGQHIELCRKVVATNPWNDNIKINWNENLYRGNKDKIYADGADFKEETYIHLKIRDLRLEMSMSEFNELADTIIKAREKLNVVAKNFR